MSSVSSLSITVDAFSPALGNLTQEGTSVINHHLSSSSPSNQESLHPGAGTPHPTRHTNSGGEGQAAASQWVPLTMGCVPLTSQMKKTPTAAGVSVDVQPLAGNRTTPSLSPFSKKCAPRLQGRRHSPAVSLSNFSVLPKANRVFFFLCLMLLFLQHKFFYVLCMPITCLP